MEVGGWVGRLYTYRYTVTTRMTSASRWEAMRNILMFHNCEGQSHKAECPQTTTFEEKREPKRIRTEVPLLTSLKLFLNWANVCSPNIIRTVRRTMIRFLIELLVPRTWFGQFDEIYFFLNWLVTRSKLRPEFCGSRAADRMIENVG